MAWFWDEASDQSEDGNAHVGYGIGVDMESISAEELESRTLPFLLRLTLIPLMISFTCVWCIGRRRCRREYRP